MNWYKKARALEPGAWSTDTKTHRLQQHQDFVRTPYGGTVIQKQNVDDLKSAYQGVHLTDSLTLAALYANNKSTQEDPPVIIELSKHGMEAIPDIDADLAGKEVVDFLRGNNFADILSQDTEDEEKVDEIFSNLESVEDYPEEIGSPSDSILLMEKKTAARALISFLEGNTAEQTIQLLRNMLAGDIPGEVEIEMVNQFRVMKPVEHTSINRVFEMDRVDLETDFDGYQFHDLTDEELENKGYRRVNGEYFDSENRLMVDRNEVQDGSFWLRTKEIYRNPSILPGEVTYHGTTLSRARRAYPQLF